MKSGNRTTVYIDALPLCELRVSGIGHLTLEMVRAMSRNKELHVVLVVPLGKRKLAERHNVRGVTIKVLPLHARIFSILLRLRLMPPVDLFIGRGVYIFPNYRNWPLLYSKSLTYIHDVVFMKHPTTVSPKNLKYLLHNYKLWLKRADMILTLSNSSKSDIVNELKVSPTQVRVVGCGVDAAVYNRKTEVEIAAAKAKYGVDTDKYLLCIGNFEPRKNLERLIEAYKTLPKLVRDEYSLYFVGGGGWLNESIMNAIEKASREKYKVFKVEKYVEDNDLPALISGATALVHPSLYEGFGIPPLQAMACSVPVVVANNSSLPEVVGDAGLMVDAEDISDISDKIRIILSDDKLQNSMRTKGLNQARHFTWENSAAEVYDCIKEVTGNV